MAFDFSMETVTSISTTEWSMPSDVDFAVAPTKNQACQVQLWVFIQGMAPGDEFIVRLYERMSVFADGSRSMEHESWRLAYPKDRLIQAGLILHNDWDFTIQKVAGSDRLVEWSLRRVI